MQEKKQCLEKSLEQIRRSIIEKNIVIFAADCEVFYEGRGTSRLGRGERLIVCKPDGAVLVHRPTGYEPVNWQPPGTLITVNMKEGYGLMRVVRQRPREVLEIKIYDVKGVAAWKLRDTAVFEEGGSEKDMQQAVIKQPELIEPGLKILTAEYPVSSGFIDVLAEDSKRRLTIIELKRRKASLEAVLQLKRYVESMKKMTGRSDVRGVLAAPSISPDALKALRSLDLEFKELKPEECLKIVKANKAGRLAV